MSREFWVIENCVGDEWIPDLNTIYASSADANNAINEGCWVYADYCRVVCYERREEKT